ncbi:hypothetical protein [Maribacter arcticus]|uniref:Uncharacterized protein n=1 Tax=Maribacter arcticus TaxID=561365 RepID=A0A1T5EFG7_9FLAO|nr:hypothetical protein [Maribacter arcticus]SKB82656.1 hypothetical protein SAMN05660866_03505 [Maribacter arcticus]
MKKGVLLLIAILFVSYTFGQNKIKTYLPDGTDYAGSGTTINQLNKEFEEHGRVYTYDADNGDSMSMVGFKLFTNEPLWVLTDDKSTIQKSIESFNVDDFLYSYKCEMEIEKFIKKGTLSDIFILETLGQPDNKSKYFDEDIQIDLWTYRDIGTTLSFRNGIAKSYTKTE